MFRTEIIVGKISSNEKDMYQCMVAIFNCDGILVHLIFITSYAT